MSKLEDRFYEDRGLRDAARNVLMADIEHARTSFSAKGVANRVGTRIGDGAVDVFETARGQSRDNLGIIAALIGAVLLWLGRQPVLDALGAKDGDEDSDSSSEIVNIAEPDQTTRDGFAANTPTHSGDNDEQ